MLTNADISELLAREADHARMPLQKALRRASRKAFLWDEEAAQLLADGRSLTELAGVGPSLNRVITRWLNDPPAIPERPEIRGDFLTFPQARAVLAASPSWSKHLKGDLQMHTTWSDGEGTIKDMADAAVARGYEYIAITDHSKGLKIAGGINEAQLQEQGEEIAQVNTDLQAAGHPLRLLASVELNLDPQGGGDMDPASLANLDIVLGCFHSALRRKEDQTERYIAALQNPDIQIVGHPRGRIFNFRLGLTADWRRVFDTAAELDKAVEIDSYPDRQDLNVSLLKLAREAGCRISIGTDSHGPSQLRFIEFGLAAACIAGISEDRILTFMSRKKLLAWVSEVRGRHR